MTGTKLRLREVDNGINYDYSYTRKDNSLIGSWDLIEDSESTINPGVEVIDYICLTEVLGKYTVHSMTITFDLENMILAGSQDWQYYIFYNLNEDNCTYDSKELEIDNGSFSGSSKYSILNENTIKVTDVDEEGEFVTNWTYEFLETNKLLLKVNGEAFVLERQ